MINTYDISFKETLSELRKVITSLNIIKAQPTEDIFKSNVKIENFIFLQDLGNFGFVQKALYKDTEVIVKKITKKYDNVDAWTKSQQFGIIPTEIAILCHLNLNPHKNITKLLFFFQDEFFFHAVYKNTENCIDLFDFIDRNNLLDENVVKHIFRQIVEAVDHLHVNNIVHRDIKDENILINDQFEIFLIDFDSSVKDPFRKLKKFVGTLAFASPEIIKGNPYDGFPQDIYALGILLYTIAFKKNPFIYYSDDVLIKEKLIFPKNVSFEFQDLVKWLLKNDPRDRPTTKQILLHAWFNHTDK